MSPSPLPVPIQIGFHSHFVATVAGVERYAAQAWRLTFDLGFPLCPEVLNLPDQFPVIRRRFEFLQTLLVEVELSSVEVQET